MDKNLKIHSISWPNFKDSCRLKIRKFSWKNTGIQWSGIREWEMFPIKALRRSRWSCQLKNILGGLINKIDGGWGKEARRCGGATSEWTYKGGSNWVYIKWRELDFTRLYSRYWRDKLFPVFRGDIGWESVLSRSSFHSLADTNADNHVPGLLTNLINIKLTTKPKDLQCDMIKSRIDKDWIPFLNLKTKMSNSDHFQNS